MNFIFILNLVLLYIPLFSGREIGRDYLGIDFPIFIGLLINAILGTILYLFIYSINRKNKIKNFLSYTIFFIGITGSYISGKSIWLIFFWEITSLGIFSIYSNEELKMNKINSLLAYFLGSSLSMLFLSIWVFLPESNFSYTFFIIALLIKSGFSFLHIWYPESYIGASSHLSAAFSGLSLNLSFLLFLRYANNWFSQIPNSNYLLILAGVGVFLGGISAFFSKDIQKAFSYSSIEFSNLIWFFLFSHSIWKISSETEIQNISKSFLVLVYLLIFTHSFSKSFQFFVFGKLAEIAKTTDIDKLKGVGKLIPISKLILGIGTFSFASLPGTLGFLSESTVLFLISKIIDMKLIDSLFFLLGIIFIILGMILGMSTHLKVYFSLFLSTPSINHTFSISYLYKFSIKSLAFFILIFPNIFFFVIILNNQFNINFLKDISIYQSFYIEYKTFPLYLQIWFTKLTLISLLFSIIYILIYFFKLRHKISKQKTWDCGNEYRGNELSIPGSIFSEPLYSSVGRYFIAKDGEPYLDSFVKKFSYSILNLGKYWINKVESGEISYYILFSVLSFILSLAIIVSLKVYF